MVAFAKNEDELAGVVAHELGHIVARHSTMDMTILLREILGVTQVTNRRDVFEKYNLFIETPRANRRCWRTEEPRIRNQNAADLMASTRWCAPV